MPAPPITPMPPAPSRGGDPVNFSNEADAFLTAMPTFGTEVQAVGDYAGAQATAAEGFKDTAATAATAAEGFKDDAETAATASAASAADSESFATSVINTANSIGTSTTSNSFGTGAKNFVTQTGKSWANGQFVQLTLTSDVTKFMVGQVTGYDTGTGSLDVNVVYENHTGTFASWNITVTAPVDLVNILEPRIVTASTTFATSDDVNYDSSGGSISQTLTAPVAGAQLILHHMVGGSNDLTFAPDTGVTVVAPLGTVTDADTIDLQQGETMCLAYKATNIWEIR